MAQEQDAPPPVVTVRLRKRDGSYAGCTHGDQSFEPDADGIVTVPSDVAGVLTESFGYEVVPQIRISITGLNPWSTPEGPAGIDVALDQLADGVQAEGERVDALSEEALAGVPEGQIEAVRAEVASEQAASTDETEATHKTEETHETRETEASSHRSRSRRY